MPVEFLAAPAPLGLGSLSLLDRTFTVLAAWAALLVLGFGAVTFARPALETISDTVTYSFSRSFLVGLLVQVLALPTAALVTLGLALTAVGIVVIPFVLAVSALTLLAVMVLGTLAAAHAMGETWTRRRMALGVVVSPNSYRYLHTGLLAVTALWWLWALFGGLPVAGLVLFAAAVLATWVVLTAGAGATVLSRVGMRQEFARRLLPAEALTDEHWVWATPLHQVEQRDR
jgi:hypothetical protein